jgi:UDP-N-acetylglucosamine 1-carboxyvinyltransferase
MNNLKRVVNKKPGQIQLDISGAKNSAIKLLAASLLTQEVVSIKNLPSSLLDIKDQLSVYRDFGLSYEISKNHYKTLSNKFHSVDSDLNFTFRTTYLMVVGSLLNHGNAFLFEPSGCQIGNRSIDLHLKLLSKFNIKIKPKARGFLLETIMLKGCEFKFPYLTVGGTELGLLLGSISRGQTILRNAYITPELLNLINMLRLMGGEILIDGNKIIIDGKDSLSGCDISVIPDRIEVITWLCYFLASGSKGVLCNVNLNDIAIPLIHLENIGLKYTCTKSSIEVEGNSSISSFEVAAGVHPGIVTDMQPFFSLVALFAEDASKIHDYRYFDRFQYAHELNKLGFDIKFESGSINIYPAKKSKISTIRCPDLRGGMMLVLYLAISRNESKLINSNVIYRGYDDLNNKFNSLGIELINA